MAPEIHKKLEEHKEELLALAQKEKEAKPRVSQIAPPIVCPLTDELLKRQQDYFAD